MVERSLVDRVMREQEEVEREEIGPYSALLLLAEVVEDQGRRLKALEQIVLYGGRVPRRTSEGAAP